MRVQHRHQQAPELVEAPHVRAIRALDAPADEYIHNATDRNVAPSGFVVVRWSVRADATDPVDVLVCELSVNDGGIAVVPTTRVLAP
jgi:hypothetical protein